jgi:hypothetical protein
MIVFAIKYNIYTFNLHDSEPTVIRYNRKYIEAKMVYYINQMGWVITVTIDMFPAILPKEHMPDDWDSCKYVVYMERVTTKNTKIKYCWE